MTIYFQHVGKENAARDFPETIGTDQGLRRYRLVDLEDSLADLDLIELLEIRSKVANLAPDGFQIWGIPSGAEPVLKSMQTGDHLMLMPSKEFTYCGEVIHRFSRLNHDLSNSLWGEPSFPIIILLRGEWISFAWDMFKETFGFASNWELRGTAKRLLPTRVADSSFQTEDAFISHLLSNTGLGQIETIDLLNDTNEEIIDKMIRLPRYAELTIAIRQGQPEFRENLIDLYGQCMITDCQHKQVLEACHIVPYSESYDNSMENGLLLRADIHTLFDRGLIQIDLDFSVKISEIIKSQEYTKLKGKNVDFDPSLNEDRIMSNLGKN